MHPAKRIRTSPVVSFGGLCVDPYGLGTMPLGIEYPDPEKRPSRTTAVGLLHTAFRSGVELLDTADSYYAGPGGSAEAAEPHYVERVIAEAIRTYDADGSKIRVCTKGGMRRVDNTSRGWRPRACSRSAVHQMITASFDALGGNRPIDIYMLHHTDALSKTQLEEALLVMKEAVAEGRVRCLGLANATVPNLELAERLGVEIAAVQNQYSLWMRDAEKCRPHGAPANCRRGVLSWCASRGLAFMPYGVFGGVQNRDGRRSLQHSFPRLLHMAAAKDTSPESLVLAWMRQRFPHIVHITGARSRQHILDCASARLVRLSDREIDEISSLKPAASSHVGRCVSTDARQFVHLEKGTLSNRLPQMLHDFDHDLQQLAAETGATITLRARQDGLSITGSADGQAAVISRLDEIFLFYFGHGLPL